MATRFLLFLGSSGNVPSLMDRPTKENPYAPPTKRSRDEAELASLAERFRADWRPGDRVMTWLNRHEGRAGELSALVQDGWSWAGIGQAMFLAGIGYSTGRPIDGNNLRWKAHKSRRLESKRQNGLSGEVRSPAVRSSASPVLPPSIVLVDAGDPVEAEPEFKPVAFLDWDEKRPDQKQAEPLPTPSSEPRKQRSPDAVKDMLARLAGKP